MLVNGLNEVLSRESMRQSAERKEDGKRLNTLNDCSPTQHDAVHWACKYEQG